jgi:primary-amine oxidase
MHHVPHTGDLPNTVFTTAQSSVMFTPHNYLLQDASRATSQMIRINYGDETATDVETFGQVPASGLVDMEHIAWDPSTYYGDITTRKFPYEGAGREDSE